MNKSPLQKQNEITALNSEIGSLEHELKAITSDIVKIEELTNKVKSND